MGEPQTILGDTAVAVIPEMNEKSVFVVHDGKAERRVVETGTRLENSVHIVSGLKPGDEVITSALQQMRNGQAVRIAKDTIDLGLGAAAAQYPGR